MVLTRGDLRLCPWGLMARKRAVIEAQKSAEAIVTPLARSEGLNEMSGCGP